YAQGGLTPQQRRAFEKRFLRSPEDHQKVAVAGALLNKAFDVRAAREHAAAPAIGWWQAFRNSFMLGSPGLRYAFRAAGLALLVAVSWSVYQTGRLRSQLENLEAQRRLERQSGHEELAQERARREELERQLAQRRSSPLVLGFVLSPGLVRGGGEPNRIVIPPDVETVRLELTRKTKAEYRSFRAEVKTLDGKLLWSGDLPTPIVSLPARLLPPDDYVIELKGINSPREMENAGDFYFTVRRK